MEDDQSLKDYIRTYLCHLCQNLYNNFFLASLYEAPRTWSNYICKFCTRIFNKISDFQAHLSMTHASDTNAIHQNRRIPSGNDFPDDLQANVFEFSECNEAGRHSSTTRFEYDNNGSDAVSHIRPSCQMSGAEHDYRTADFKSFNESNSQLEHTGAVFAARDFGNPILDISRHSYIRNDTELSAYCENEKEQNVITDRSTQNECFSPNKEFPSGNYSENCEIFTAQGSTSQDHESNVDIAQDMETHRDISNHSGTSHSEISINYLLEDHSLEHHTSVHRIKKKYKCERCEKSFMVKSSLETHMSVHGVKQLKCAICGRLFAKKFHLIRHWRVHTKEKPFKCEICEKTFSRKTSLTQHMRVHTKEKPFKCEICEKTFSQKTSLTRHMRVHTKEKPFKCEICEKTFSHRVTLSYHIGAHKKKGKVI